MKKLTPKQLLDELMEHHNEMTAILTILKQRLNASAEEKRRWVEGKGFVTKEEE